MRHGTWHPAAEHPTDELRFQSPRQNAAYKGNASTDSVL